MSAATEIAEREAAEAEAEHPDDDEAEHESEVETPDEPEDEPEPPTPAPSVDFEKMFSTLDKEAERHAKRVREVMGGEFAEVKPCPLCHPSIPGFVGPVSPDGFDPVLRMAVYAAMGDDPEPAYLTAPEAKMCETCGGYGATLTGSKNPLQRTKACAPCEGKGWVANIPHTPNAIPNPNGFQVDTTTGEITPTLKENDPWGRPPMHPDYDIDPVSAGWAR